MQQNLDKSGFELETFNSFKVGLEVSEGFETQIFCDKLKLIVQFQAVEDRRLPNETEVTQLSVFDFISIASQKLPKTRNATALVKIALYYISQYLFCF